MPKIYSECYVDEKNGLLQWYEIGCSVCHKRVIVFKDDYEIWQKEDPTIKYFCVEHEDEIQTLVCS